MFAFVLLCLLGGTVARKLTTNEFCRFDEVLKADLRQLPCDSDWNECASKARHLVQNKKFGSWGAVVLGNPDDISEGKIDWHIPAYFHLKAKCRMLINDSMIIEVFQTGQLAVDSNRGREQWEFLGNSTSNLGIMESCPHSSLRQILLPFWDKKHSHLVSRHRRANSNSAGIFLYNAAKRLSNLFFDETGHKWNVFIARTDPAGTPLKIGFDLPLHYYDARPGFCIGKSHNGYLVVAVVNEYSED